MKNHEYTIAINANKQKVWDTMLGDDTYPEWMRGFSENSEKVGEWKQGTQMDFIDPGKGGTRATLEVVDEPNRVLANHSAVLTPEGDLDTESDAAKKWIGTTEEYVLTEDNGVTNLKIIMHCHDDFKDMFDKYWPICLKMLKELCEKGIAPENINK